MSKSTDFSSMTLEELTPIVSMRPGKEYTREQLREARSAFMAKLASSDGTDCLPTEDCSVENQAYEIPEAPSVPDIPEVTTGCEAPFTDTVSPETEDSVATTEDMTIPVFEEASAPKQETPAEAPVPSPASDHVASSAVPFTPTENIVDTSTTTAEAAADAPEDVAEEFPEEFEEEFILKTESRLARFLYIFYAYFTVPLLAAEALIFLLTSVATAVAVPNIPYLLLHIFCAALYTMAVALAWHQLLHRTKFGLLLNRALIVVCILRGISMLFLGETILSGILFIALSLLFLVFFLGYDSTFTIKSPKKQHVR